MTYVWFIISWECSWDTCELKCYESLRFTLKKEEFASNLGDPIIVFRKKTQLILVDEIILRRITYF